MSKISNKTITKIIGKVTGADLSQDLNTGNTGSEEVTPEIIALCRKAAAEGAVLLKNDGTLPINENEIVSVFGRCAYDYFAVGYGSGGDVVAPYTVNFIDGLRNAGVIINNDLDKKYTLWRSKPKNEAYQGFWGHWPFSYDEMPVDAETAKAAAQESDIAFVVIARAAGEDRENTLTKGCYYLSDDERKLLKTVTEAFDKTVVILNIGNIIDFSWINEYKINAVLLPWQGGMESGNAAVDVLTGKISPCGKLSDTVAKDYYDYPSANSFGNKKNNDYSEDIYVGYRYFETFKKDSVLFPFGFGLSYTEFELNCSEATVDGTNVRFTVCVKNTGKMGGKEVVQIYTEAPQGKLGKAAKVLSAFAKTDELKPGEEQYVDICFDLSTVASYDDSNATGHKSAFVLEEGKYRFHMGNNVRDTQKIYEYYLPELIVTEQLSEVLAVKSNGRFDRMINKDGIAYEPAPTVTTCLQQIIVNNIPEDIDVTGDAGYKLIDVKNGKIPMETFIAQLNDEELELLTRGEGKMDSALGAKGNAGAFAGVSESLRAKGIPAVITTDGPAGIRLRSTCSLLPCGTLLACTWDIPLVTELYEHVGYEMSERGTDVLLAPGMNIHRNPLCGRNFEYFSEDPLLSGKMGAAYVNGIQKDGRSACPKHFACNHQETNRCKNDSRVSERALREIYLKNFEICIKESKPLNIMTSYNKINNVWSHYNYELIETVLRKEWGYEGNVITDWWMQYAPSPEFPNVRDNAYRVRSGVNVLMPGLKRTDKEYIPDGTLFESLGQFRGITRGEVQRAVGYVLNMAMNSSAMDRK